MYSGSESDTTAEPHSDTEYFDDRTSLSIASTTRGNEQAVQEVNDGDEDVEDLSRSSTLDVVLSPTEDIPPPTAGEVLFIKFVSKFSTVFSLFFCFLKFLTTCLELTWNSQLLP